MKYTNEEIIEIAKTAHCITDLCRKIGLPVNGSGFRKTKFLIKELGIILDIDKYKLNRKYETIEKVCPVCSSKFETQLGHIKEQTVCSRACSNTFFRSGENNGNYKHGYAKFGTDYRMICFQNWEHKCALCDWIKVVEVHHIDSNHQNNDIKNLIPLCPNHHRLTMMADFKEEINKQIKELVWKKFKDEY